MVYRSKDGGVTRPALEYVRKIVGQTGKKVLGIYGTHGGFTGYDEFVNFVLDGGDIIETEGFCWGYFGEGPHGLVTIAAELGFKRLTSEAVGRLDREKNWYLYVVDGQECLTEVEAPDPDVCPYCGGLRERGICQEPCGESLANRFDEDAGK